MCCLQMCLSDNWQTFKVSYSPGIMRKVKRDACFDVVSEAQVSQRGQGHVQDDDDAHADVEGLRESLRFPHLILQWKNLQKQAREK